MSAIGRSSQKPEGLQELDLQFTWFGRSICESFKELDLNKLLRLSDIRKMTRLSGRERIRKGWW